MKGAHLVRAVVVKHSIEGVTNMTDSLALLNHMKKFGNVTMFKFMRDPLSNERTGLVHMSYQHLDDAVNALTQRRQVVSALRAPYNIIDVSPYKSSK